MAYSIKPSIITNGLVFAVDAGDPSSYISGSLNWNDLTSVGNNGILTNGTTYNSGNFGSMQFDGVNDFVDFTAASALKPTGAMTISYWFKGKSATVSTSGVGTMGGNGFRGYLLGVNNSNEFIMYISSNSTTLISVPYIQTIDTNLWYHIAGVYTPSTSLELYINGSLVATNTTSIPASQYQGNNITLKVGNRGDAAYFTGLISSVQFYNRSLTATEINKNYTAQKGKYGI
jgi:hypothetical protein